MRGNPVRRSNPPTLFGGLVSFQAHPRPFAISIDEDHAGVLNRTADMQERCGRFEERARKKRELVCTVMEEAELKKLSEPGFTVSRRPARAPLMVIDEAAILGDYWRPQPAKLDRMGLIGALSNGRDIPGAVLGNPPMTIAVRTK